MGYAFVFPGQGSQCVGMGLSLRDSFAVARAVFEEVDDALGEHLSRLIFSGPEDDLTLTANAQPALMAVGVAALRVLEAESGEMPVDGARFVAGHSLGEYTALVAARALPLAAAARVLRIRGQAMQEVVPPGEGAMAAVIGLDFDQVAALAREAAQDDVCQPANDNAPGQVVISGTRAAVERAVALADEHGAKRAITLPVSAPFHCALMTPVEEIMQRALDDIKLASPVVPLVANVTADSVTAVADIRRLLVQQVASMVRWRESVGFMVDNGVTTLIEVGAGRVLSGLARRIDRSLTCVSVHTPDDIDPALKILS